MKKTYDVEVDCANCAAKMEEAVKNTEGVKNATLSFMTLRLNLKKAQMWTLLCSRHTRTAKS